MSISTSPPKRKVTEAEIDAVINKGGKAAAETDPEPEPVAEPATAEKAAPADLNATKSIKLIMTSEEMETIKQLRSKRPQRSRNRKITISVHDWVIEAVQEKIERERRKYSV